MHPPKRIKLKLLINRKDFVIQKKLLPYMLKALFQTQSVEALSLYSQLFQLTHWWTDVYKRKLEDPSPPKMRGLLNNSPHIEVTSSILWFQTGFFFWMVIGNTRCSGSFLSLFLEHILLDASAKNRIAKTSLLKIN